MSANYYPKPNPGHSLFYMAHKLGVFLPFSKHCKKKKRKRKKKEEKAPMTTCGLQSLKHLLFDPLQKKFVDSRLKTTMEINFAHKSSIWAWFGGDAPSFFT